MFASASNIDRKIEANQAKANHKTVFHRAHSVGDHATRANLNHTCIHRSNLQSLRKSDPTGSCDRSAQFHEQYREFCVPISGSFLSKATPILDHVVHCLFVWHYNKFLWFCCAAVGIQFIRFDWKTAAHKQIARVHSICVRHFGQLFFILRYLCNAITNALRITTVQVSSFRDFWIGILCNAFLIFRVRGVVSGFIITFSYMLAFILTKTRYFFEVYLSLPGITLLLSIIIGFGLILLYYILPETTNRSLEDIELHFADNSKKLTNRKIKIHVISSQTTAETA